MILKKRIVKEFITTASVLKTKDEILHFITKDARKSPALSDIPEATLLENLLEREKLCSTGLGDGIAIPHCTLDEIDDFVVGFISLKDGVDFESIDGKPVRLIFYIIGPRDRRKTHINLLSAISKLLKDGDNRKKLEEADTVVDVLDVLSENGEEGEGELAPRPKSLFQVVIQKESIFTDILEILTSGEDSNVSVLDGKNASGYLHQLPLFSTYWTDEGDNDRFNRMILAVVDRHTCNDLIRRIKLIDGYDRNNPGFLITVQEAVYVEGSLEY